MTDRYFIYPEGKFLVLCDNETGKEIGFTDTAELCARAKELGLTRVPFELTKLGLKVPVEPVPPSSPPDWLRRGPSVVIKEMKEKAESLSKAPFGQAYQVAKELGGGPIAEAVERYLIILNKLAEISYSASVVGAPKFKIAKGGRRYWKVVATKEGRVMHVVIFIEKETGLFWKAASFKNPARNFPRGNVLDLRSVFPEVWSIYGQYLKRALDELGTQL